MTGSIIGNFQSKYDTAMTRLEDHGNENWAKNRDPDDYPVNL